MRSDTPLFFRNIRFGYDKEELLRDFSLELKEGEVTLLAGPNGEGKTTALWLAMGLLKPDSGTIRMFGKDPFTQREILGECGFFAEGAPLPENWTCQQILEFQEATFPRWDREESAALLKRFGLDSKQRVKRLSRGERGKLALIATLCTRPKLLLLDEPTLGLDVATRRLLTSEILSQLAEAGTSILMCGHEIADAELRADRLVVINKGTVGHDEEVMSLLERHRILSWPEKLSAPPKALDLLDLPDRMGHRALARRWDEALAAEWLRSGGKELHADLETIYLSLTGELDYA